VARYDLDTGELIWVKQIEGCATGYGIVHDDVSPNALVTGAFQGTIAIESEDEEPFVLTAYGVDVDEPPEPGNTDVYVASLNVSTGAAQWAVSAGGGGLDFGARIAQLSGGSVLTTGLFSGEATFTGFGATEGEIITSASDRGVYIARYTSSGSLAWIRHADARVCSCLFEMIMLENGDFVLGGNFQDEAVFGRGEANETTLVSTGGEDLFLARYEADGDLVWACRASGGNGNEHVFGLASPLEGDLLATGSFEGSVTFGEGQTEETQLEATIADGYVMKIEIGG
jgi:outer membrane protein assembly factor BamB